MIEPNRKKVVENKRQKLNYDPRRKIQRFLPQQNQFLKRPSQTQQFKQQLNHAQRLHFQKADNQVQEAIRKQGCLSKPFLCDG